MNYRINYYIWKTNKKHSVIVYAQNEQEYKLMMKQNIKEKLKHYSCLITSVYEIETEKYLYKNN